MSTHKYYKIQQEMLFEISKMTIKPKLLMHSCCGPCNTFPLELLSSYFNLTLYFNNHNIFPHTEFEKRYDELKKYVQIFEKENDVKIQIIKSKYEDDQFNQILESRNSDDEGGIRCRTCYAMRMTEAWGYAAEHGFDYFTTVMTTSQHKDSEIINDIAKRLQPKYPEVQYFYSDFKKNKGLERSIQLSKKHQLYRQSYCGCIYSFNDYEERRCKHAIKTNQ